VFNIRYPQHCFYRVTVNLLCFIQRIVTYTFFLKRLRTSFSNSMYHISTCKFSIILILNYVTLFGAAVFISVSAYFYGEFLCATNNIIKIAIGVAGIIDIFWVIFVTYMFVNRLNKLLSSKEDWKFEKVMKKLTLLTVVMVTTTLIFSITFGVLDIIPYQGYAFDLIINTMCIMLSFKEMDYQYSITCSLCISIQNMCCFKRNQITTNDTRVNDKKQFKIILPQNSTKIELNVNAYSTANDYTPTNDGYITPFDFPLFWPYLFHFVSFLCSIYYRIPPFLCRDDIIF